MDTELVQLSLLEGDRVTVDVTLSMYHGWEWSVRQYDGGRWSIVDSGLASSPENALVAAADALVATAQAWDGF